MDDVEARLRETLRRNLDPIAPDDRRAATVPGRARRGRALRGLGVAATVVALVAAGTTAGAWLENESTPPASDGLPRLRAFDVSFDRPPSGRVVVDTARELVCYSAFVMGPAAADLRLGEDEVVATFFDTPQDHEHALCAPLPREAADHVLDHPAEYALVFHGGGPDPLIGDLEVPSTNPSAAPDRAEIVCHDGAAIPLTPVVQPRRDGIHLRIYNYGTGAREFMLHDRAGDNELGRLPEDDFLDNTSRIRPGPLDVGCFESADDIPWNETDPSPFAELTIVDPDDLWTEPELECGEGRERRMIVTDEVPSPEPGALPDVEALIREHVPGLLPGDVLERPGYPESIFIFEPRTVVRDGRRVASLSLVREDGYWAFFPRSCRDTGIADPEGA